MFFNSQSWRMVKNVQKLVHSHASSCVNSQRQVTSETAKHCRCLQFSCPMKLCMSLVIRATDRQRQSCPLFLWSYLSYPRSSFTFLRKMVHAAWFNIYLEGWRNKPQSFLIFSKPFISAGEIICEPLLSVPFEGSQNVKRKQQFGTVDNLHNSLIDHQPNPTICWLHKNYVLAGPVQALFTALQDSSFHGGRRNTQKPLIYMEKNHGDVLLCVYMYNSVCILQVDYILISSDIIVYCVILYCVISD